MAGNTTGVNNTAVGTYCLDATTTADANTAVGYQAQTSSTTGATNTSVGYYAGWGITTGGTNSCLGGNAGKTITTGGNNVCVGYNSGDDALRALTTASNEIVMGNDGSTGGSFIKTDWTTGSDIRDKTDIETLPDSAGLNFVKQLRPVTYVWDNRGSYYDFKDPKYGERPNHSKKEIRKHVGFIAQEIVEIEKSIGWEDDHIVNTDNEHSYTLKYSAVIPMLTKAIQELSAKVEDLENNNKE
jgi:hypothetical protein